MSDNNFAVSSECIPNAIRFKLDTTYAAIDVRAALPLGDMPVGGWPVLWLLDPENYFAAAVDTMNACSVRADATGIVPSVIVGIGLDAGNGGATTYEARRLLRERFFFGEARNELSTLIRKDISERVQQLLSKHLGREVRFNNGRHVIAGHSLSGVAALRAALASPTLFSGVAAISPSLWRESEELLQLARSFVATNAKLSVLLAVGEYEQGLAPWEEEERGRGRGREGVEVILMRRQQRRMVDHLKEFGAELNSSVSESGLTVDTRILADSDHASARVVALPLTLRLLRGKGE